MDAKEPKETDISILDEVMRDETILEEMSQKELTDLKKFLFEERIRVIQEKEEQKEVEPLKSIFA